MSAENEAFADAVLGCVEDVNELLPQLAKHYPDLVMVTALADHVGAALQLSIRNGTCTSEQARHFMAHVRHLAFSPHELDGDLD